MLGEWTASEAFRGITAVLFAAAIILLFAAAGQLLLWLLHHTVFRLTRRTSNRADDIVRNVISGPIVWAALLFGIQVAQAQTRLLHEEWANALSHFLFVAFSLLVYATIYRLLRDLMDYYIHEKARETQSTLDDLLLPFIRRLLFIVLTSLVVLFILQHFNINVGTFLATLGVGSLAVALAAQAALSDIISGFLILLDQRYRLGDRIELLNEGIIGDVAEIGLRTTRVLTMDNRLVIIPNSMIANNMVINHAYPDSTLRVDLPVGVAYGTDIRQVKAILLNALRQVKGVHRDRHPDVVFQGFGDSAVNLEMRCWIDAYADKPRMIDRINEAAYNALNEAGIEIPFPQSTLWHRIEAAAIPDLRAALGAERRTAPLPPALGGEDGEGGA